MLWVLCLMEEVRLLQLVWVCLLQEVRPGLSVGLRRVLLLVLLLLLLLLLL